MDRVANTRDGTWGRSSTRAQRARRRLVLARWPQCYLGYDGCTGHATEDDHVVPLAEGGSDDWDNHRGACHNCHQRKSQAEAARGRARQRAKGLHRIEHHPGLQPSDPVPPPPTPHQAER